MSWTRGSWCRVASECTKRHLQALSQVHEPGLHRRLEAAYVVILPQVPGIHSGPRGSLPCMITSTVASRARMLRDLFGNTCSASQLGHAGPGVAGLALGVKQNFTRKHPSSVCLVVVHLGQLLGDVGGRTSSSCPSRHALGCPVSAGMCHAWDSLARPCDVRSEGGVGE